MTPELRESLIRQMTPEQRESLVREVEGMLLLMEDALADGMKLPQTVTLMQVEGLPFQRIAITREKELPA